MSNPFSTPDPPNPQKVAAAQSAANKETAVAQANLNNYNQVTPQGSLTYSVIGTNADGTPKYQSTQTYSPEQQAIYEQNAANSLQSGQIAGNQLGRVNDVLSTPFQLGATPQQSGINLNNNLGNRTDISQSNIDDRLYQLGTERLDPRFAQQQQTLESDLANRGVVPGTEAYDRAMTNFEQTRNDAYNQLALTGNNQAYQQELGTQQFYNTANAQNAQFGNQATQQQANFNNTAQSNNWNQMIQDALLQRNQPINETTALMSGSQVSQPNYQATPQTGIANTDVAGLYQNNYNAQVAQQNAMMGGLGAIGGGLASTATWSDRRMKKDIKKVGKLGDGVNLYTYKYKDKFGLGGLAHLGVMAQEIEPKIPDAVVDTDSGFKAVDYARVLEEVA